MDDWILLSRFVESGCQESFEQIVARHSGWVYALSLRAVRDRHLAEDVTQAVFLVLARKARTIRAGTPISGWLFKVSRFAVSDALKRRARIKNRENRFAEFFKATSSGFENGMQPQADQISDSMSQTLDEAVACLSESDRQVILLRFYEHKSLAEIGTILEISEEAAKKRVARAVERLRKYFSTRGIVASIALLLLLLSQRSAEAALLPAVIAPAAAPSIAVAIADGAIRLMGQAQARLLGAILAAGLALMIAVPTLGGALVRSVVATTAPTPAVVESKPLPGAPIHIESSNSITLGDEPRFSDLWIGYKGELLWRSDAYAGPRPTPFILQSAEQRERPYAVAVDGKGNFFLRPLKQSFLQSPVIRQANFDYDNGAIEPSARVRAMMSAIDLMPPEPGRARSGHSARAPQVKMRNDPSIEEQKADDEWQKMKQEKLDDGSTFVHGAGLNTSGTLDGMTNSYQSQTNGSRDFWNSTGRGGTDDLFVPEPGMGLMVLAGAGLLARRRRKA